MVAHVLMLGWHPDVVNYAKWPDLTPEKLDASLKQQQQALEDAGHKAKWALVRTGDEAVEMLRDILMRETFDIVLIGAGVRRDEDHFLTFEALINVIHSEAPKARLVFNTNPADTVDAVNRWL